MKRFLSQAQTAILSVAILPVLLCSAPAQETCKLTEAGTGKVASVRDGRTLLLVDGRELRLAAIEVADESRSLLQSLVGGRDVRLRQLGPQHDRYGRLVAFIYADDSQRSVQQAMLEQGQARVSARIGDKSCADALLHAERAARGSRLGLWADPNFAPLKSENINRIVAARGQFALVEGKVLSVRESGATMYLNFGRRWTHDFTVTILKRHRRDFATTGIDPKRLEGHPIRVRGWIEQRNGPVIEAVAPEQIELIE
ncbi:MAG: thermonuclease family protein [Pseudolabrys sp.]|jgi:endonuclease YncB( thermonuclease family)